MSEQISQQTTVSKPSSPHFPVSEQRMTGVESPALNSNSRNQSGLNTGRNLGQILIVLVVLLVLVNIPVNYYGVGLAHIIPKGTAMVIHDGMLLKGSGPEIYLLEEYNLRRFSSPEAFDYTRFRLNNVHTVEDSLLEQFGQGQPIRRLIQCPHSPYIYALENGQKRWVKDPPLANRTKSWDKVHQVTCNYLHRLPDGSPIPEDAGPPPQP